MSMWKHLWVYSCTHAGDRCRRMYLPNDTYEHPKSILLRLGQPRRAVRCLQNAPPSHEMRNNHQEADLKLRFGRRSKDSPRMKHATVVKKLNSKDQTTPHVKPSDCYQKVMNWDGGGGWRSDGEAMRTYIHTYIHFITLQYVTLH